MLDDKEIQEGNNLSEEKMPDAAANLEAQPVEEKNNEKNVLDTENKDVSKEQQVEESVKEAEIKEEKSNKATAEDSDAEVEAKEPESEEKTVAERDNLEVTSTSVVDKKTDKPKDKPTEPSVNYKTLSFEELNKYLQKLIKSDDVAGVKEEVDKIKRTFNKKYKELLAEKKAEFIKDNGNEIDFHYRDKEYGNFKDLLFEYKTKRDRFYKQQAQEQKENLEKRLALIEKLKELIDNAEPDNMYNDYKAIQAEWKTIGKIPHNKYNDTWRTYHHHVERFYDLLHLSNDFRDLDFKHNLEGKLQLIERAKGLLAYTDLNKAFNELQVLHQLWKEDYGPVARDKREEIWEEFSEITKQIHHKRHEYQKILDKKYEVNAEAKREIIGQITGLIGDENEESHKYWQQKIKELEALRKEFFKIGKVPRYMNEQIWQEFRAATRNFNRRKNKYYKNLKHEQYKNLEKKRELIKIAQEHKDSDDFEKTTDLMKKIQSDWKKIGHAPRKYSDKIWKEFKSACNYYFDRLHGVQDQNNKEQIAVFEKKKELLENIKSQAKNTEKLSETLINAYLDDWQKLGVLTGRMRHVEVKFNKLIQKLYEKLDVDKETVEMLKFKNVINNYIANNDTKKLNHEQLFIRRKIDEITKEVQQLENNISFFSNADDDNPLLKGVYENIENYNEELKIWQSKLDYLVGLKY
ncbi:MAG: chromosome segregation protein [Flavobacteriales bacterium]|nr:MAG: chromosome segregation protein [Flavobacteriales bacterium]